MTISYQVILQQTWQKAPLKRWRQRGRRAAEGEDTAPPQCRKIPTTNSLIQRRGSSLERKNLHSFRHNKNCSNAPSPKTRKKSVKLREQNNSLKK